MSLWLAHTGPWKSEYLLSPFQVLEEILCCSSAWPSHSDLQLPTSLLSFLCHCGTCISPTPLLPHFPYICQEPFLVLAIPSALPLGFPSQQVPGSEGFRAADEQAATLSSYETSQVLLNLSCSPSLNEKRLPGRGRRKTEPWVRHESTKDVISKIPNAPCEAQVPLLSCPLWNVECVQ